MSIYCTIALVIVLSDTPYNAKEVLKGIIISETEELYKADFSEDFKKLKNKEKRYLGNPEDFDNYVILKKDCK